MTINERACNGTAQSIGGGAGPSFATKAWAAGRGEKSAAFVELLTSTLTFPPSFHRGWF